MKIFKYLGIALLALIALTLIAATFVSGDMNYEKSVVIDASIEAVWENVNSLSDMDKWSPWDKKDPGMKKEFTGRDGTVGAKSCWESEREDVGKGCQTIANLEPPNLIETDLKFYTPYESEAKGYIRLVEEDGKTIATWGFSSTLPYPFRIMNLFMDMEIVMGEDFSYGVNTLKSLSEWN